MMHTPQQRQGGPRYGPGVLVGGFYEDTVQHSTAMAALLASAADGVNLKSARWQDRVSAAATPVPVEGPAADELMRGGDLVQVVHAPTGCALAINAPDPDRAPGSECYLPSAGPAAAPMVRNVVLLASYRATRPLDPFAAPDGVVRYGRGVHLIARHPSARGDALDLSCWTDCPLYLASQPATPMRAARYSRHQPVVWGTAAGWASVWVPQPIEPAERAVLEGLPVPCGTPLLLVHAATNVPLCLEAGIKFPTDDFGTEHEISAHLVTKLGQQLGLEHRARGDELKALPKRPLDANTFVLQRIGALPKEDAPLDGAAVVLDALAAELAERPGAVERLQSALRSVCDARGNCKAADALLALRQAGALQADGETMADLLAAYPGGAPGRLAAHAVADALQGRVGAL